MPHAAGVAAVLGSMDPLRGVIHLKPFKLRGSAFCFLKTRRGGSDAPFVLFEHVANSLFDVSLHKFSLCSYDFKFKTGVKLSGQENIFLSCLFGTLFSLEGDNIPFFLFTVITVLLWLVLTLTNFSNDVVILATTLRGFSLRLRVFRQPDSAIQRWLSQPYDVALASGLLLSCYNATVIFIWRSEDILKIIVEVESS